MTPIKISSPSPPGNACLHSQDVREYTQNRQTSRGTGYGCKGCAFMGSQRQPWGIYYWQSLCFCLLADGSTQKVSSEIENKCKFLIRWKFWAEICNCYSSSSSNSQNVRLQDISSFNPNSLSVTKYCHFWNVCWCHLILSIFSAKLCCP